MENRTFKYKILSKIKKKYIYKYSLRLDSFRPKFYFKNRIILYYFVYHS